MSQLTFKHIEKRKLNGRSHSVKVRISEISKTSKVVSFNSNDALKLSPHEIHHLIFIGSSLGVLLDSCESIRNNGEKDTHQPNVDNCNIGEEEEWTKDLLSSGHRWKVKRSKRKRK